MFRTLLVLLVVLFASTAMAQCYVAGPTYYSTTPVYVGPSYYVAPAPVYVAPPVYVQPRVYVAPPVYYVPRTYYAPAPAYYDATRGFFLAPPPLWVRGLRLGVMLSN